MLCKTKAVTAYLKSKQLLLLVFELKTKLICSRQIDIIISFIAACELKLRTAYLIWFIFSLRFSLCETLKVNVNIVKITKGVSGTF